MRRTNFDLDALRGFVAGIELGSFARAAQTLNRSTSALSAQLKKLEQNAGAPIVRRAGRHLALTEAGEVLLAYARRLLALNDEAADALSGVNLEGWVRFGVQEGLGDMLLPPVLGQFARAHPKVRIEARIGRRGELLGQLVAGRLDLALTWDEAATAEDSEHVLRMPMRWIGPAGGTPPWSPETREPLPLVVSEPPCPFRAAATTALDRAGIDWRIVFNSPNLAGLWAATQAGLGFTVLTELALPPLVSVVDTELGLPEELPTLALSLRRRVCREADASAVSTRLAEIVRQAAIDESKRCRSIATRLMKDEVEQM